MRALGKSQKALAKMLNVSPAYISQIISGKKRPPDLGRARNRIQLAVWSDFLDAAEDEILDLVRFQLHRVPPKPAPRYRNMRSYLLSTLEDEGGLEDEIRALELHPAENVAIHTLIQIYLVIQEDPSEGTGYGVVRFRELCGRARNRKDFIEDELIRFFVPRDLAWYWDPDIHDIRIVTDSEELREALERVKELGGKSRRVTARRSVPVVGHVSAGEGFAYTDGDYPVGEGFDRMELPPGVDPSLSERLYCVRVRGDSMREFINEGATLFIKPESWEEIKDGDLVVFKDKEEERAFVKKVEFAGENLVLKPLNPMFKNIVLKRSDLSMLERVLAVVF